MARTQPKGTEGVTPPPGQPTAGRTSDALYTIGVVARLASLTPGAIRAFERAGLVTPARSTGRQRFYSPQDLDRLRRLKALVSDMGVNTAGAEVALRLMDRIAELERQVQEMQLKA